MSRAAVSDQAGNAGFSLIEVLSAMLIASLSLVVLYRGLVGSGQAALYLEAHLGARLIAVSILEDERQSDSTTAETRSGDSGIYRWKLSIEPASVAAARNMPSNFRLYRMSLDVRWLPRGHLAVETLKLGR